MSNVELKLKDTINDNNIYDIYIDNVYAGGLEANYDPRINSFYIENIKKSDSYKAGHLLEDVVNYLYNEKEYDLGCLPLEKYRSYYEELGFTPFIYNDNDVYYHKIHKGDNMKTDEFLNEVKKIINEDNISQKNETIPTTLNDLILNLQQTKYMGDYRVFAYYLFNTKQTKFSDDDRSKLRKVILDRIPEGASDSQRINTLLGFKELLKAAEAEAKALRREYRKSKSTSESSQKNEDGSNNSSSLPYVVANSRLQPIEYFEDIRTANDYVMSIKKKSGIRIKDLDMFIYQTDDLRKHQIQRYGKILESSQRNEKSDFTKDQLIKISTILRTIATNSKEISVSDAAVLLKASSILTDNFIASESLNIISEGVSSKGLNYMISKLPKHYKVADIARYGQINTDDELIQAVDNEVERLKEWEKEKDNSIDAFLYQTRKILDADERISGLETDSFGIGNPHCGTGYSIRGKLDGRPFAIAFNYYFDTSKYSNQYVDFDDSGKLKKIKTISGSTYNSPKQLAKDILNGVHNY